jgi:transcriptional regulator with PAS, ATPase and Fis domain
MIFYLFPGENQIGSLPSNAVSIRAPGVSRVHAVVRVGSRGIVVEDLESKNGTYVNGTMVKNADLKPGDELGLGPIVLVLQRTAEGDRNLALLLDQQTPKDGLLSLDHSPTHEMQPREIWCCRGDLLLERVIDHLLTLPNPSFSQAMIPILEEIKTDGGCLLEWSGVGEPTVLAIAGSSTKELIGSQVKDWFLLAAMGATEAREWEVRRFGDHRLSCVVLAHQEQAPIGMVLMCDLESRHGAVAVLRNVLKVVAFLRNKSAISSPSWRGEAAELVIPPDIVIGQSDKMRALYRQMRTVAASQSSVLLAGETGVGKESVAKILHDSSEADGGPFVPINCSAIPADLIEAELFGIVEGVATGVSSRKGKFLQADGGTLFLDEISELPIRLQAKLLRVIEDGQVEPLGGKVVQVQVRIIAATNCELLERIEQGSFRRDLYYRIAAFRLDVPPLHERPEDIPALVEHYLWKLLEDLGKPVRGVTLAAMNLLRSYRWPGNVRELRNEIGRLVHSCPPGQVIGSSLISEHIQGQPNTMSTVAAVSPTKLDLKGAVAELETKMIRAALAQTGGNRTRAAELLGISRNNLLYKIKSSDLLSDLCV